VSLLAHYPIHPIMVCCISMEKLLNDGYARSDKLKYGDETPAVIFRDDYGDKSFQTFINFCPFCGANLQ